MYKRQLYGPAYQAAPIPRLTAIEEVAGMKALSALRQDEANLAETRAKTLAAGVPTSKEFDTINEAQMLANQMAAAAGGNAIGRTQYNPKTGKLFPVVTQKQLPQVPDPELVGRVESFNKEIQGLIDNGTTARQVAPQIKTLLKFISNDKLDTGAFEELKLKGRSFAKGFGLSVDETALANAEQAQAMFGRMILEYFQQTKGSISNAENQLFASFGPELGKSKKANEAILIAADKRNTLDRDLERISRDYRRAKLNGQEAQEKIQARLDEYDQEISGLLPNQGGAQPTNYGTRADGTKKGSGFLGEIKLPNGQIATEVSIGVNINGKEVEIPTLVPALTAEQRDFIAKGGNPLTRQDIVRTAIEHASKRIAAGLSPFNEPAAVASPVNQKKVVVNY